ncbi:MAG TPA: biotin/lipoyl-containing protein, partial [Caulobacteraceae bacterium]|nr:biotin/lipoyl-containing protein [Caulobacteraceae bacterium]
RTNAWFLVRCAEAPDFLAGAVDTDFIGARLETLTARPEAAPSPAAVGALAASAGAGAGQGPWSRGLAGFRMSGEPASTAKVFVDDAPVEVAFVFGPTDDVAISGPGQGVLFQDGAAFAFGLAASHAGHGVGEGGDGLVLAPMPGKIVAVSVAAGEAVKKGQALVTLEAMKMEHALTAAFDGVVTEVAVAVGDQVSEGTTLARLEAAD